MLTRTTAAILAILLGGPLACTLPAPGQGAAHTDREYCDQLIDIYQRYLSGDELGQRRPAADSNIEGRVAVAKCQAGDTATGIPILERKLTANGFSLPRRP